MRQKVRTCQDQRHRKCLKTKSFRTVEADCSDLGWPEWKNTSYSHLRSYWTDFLYCSVLVTEWSEQGGTANIVVDNCEASTWLDDQKWTHTHTENSSKSHFIFHEHPCASVKLKAPSLTREQGVVRVPKCSPLVWWTKSAIPRLFVYISL